MTPVPINQTIAEITDMSTQPKYDATPAVAPAPVNSTGKNIIADSGGTNITYTNIINAGQTLTIPAIGNTFYLAVSSGTLNITPSNGSTNPYQQGTGLRQSNTNTFNQLQVENPGAGPIAFYIVIGFDQFIDKRIYLQNNASPQVAFPTFPTANAATSLAIIDLSGTEFTDINGNKWFAIVRTAILVFNVDTGTTLLLQKAGGSGSSPAVGAIYPQTSLRFDVSGNYALNNGGGSLNCIVSEIYQAIPSPN